MSSFISEPNSLDRWLELRRKIEDQLGDGIKAFDAVAFFTATIRGFRHREVAKMCHFAKQISAMSGVSDEELHEWAQSRCRKISISDYKSGSNEGYEALLAAVPGRYLMRCKTAAYAIAMGSGRRPLNTEWEQRIELEFSESPKVNGWLPPEEPYPLRASFIPNLVELNWWVFMRRKALASPEEAKRIDAAWDRVSNLKPRITSQEEQDFRTWLEDSGDYPQTGE